MNLSSSHTKPGDGRLLIALLAICLAQVAFSSNVEPPPIDDLFVVDCLLPGQIRQLGQRTKYLSARRPIKTSAADCRIRGGEYVAFDRASYRTSLNVWLPKAKDGDPEAQTNVGEIFEKGLGGEPDYVTAADWYRRAAEQGDTRAQINLGHMYEQGLGVPADPIAAIEWYRRASGLDSSIDLEIDPPDIDQGIELESLRRQLEQVRKQSAALRRELETTQDQLREASESQIPESVPTPPPPVDESATDEAEQELELLRAEIDRRANEADQLEAFLARLQTQIETERDQLQRTSTDKQQSERELAEADARLKEIAAQAESRQLELSSLEVELGQRQARLSEQQNEIKRLNSEVERLEAESGRRREQLAALQSQEQVLEQRVLAGPEIAVIEPVLSTTRGVSVVGVPTRKENRQIVGRVTAPAGLLTLTVNEAPTQANTRGVFTTQIAIRPPRTPVSIVAVDQQGKRAAVDFVLQAMQQAEAATRESSASEAKLPSFGNFNALVIGNNKYEYLPELKTALNDATAISDVLSNQYGFKTQTLLNVTRYEILSALNDLREKLTSEDNLLIFYAGHGDLDKVNQRGHWLPIDAELDNTANWLSNVAVTDILNIMKAKQILLIVDSCYSGALTRSSITRLKTGMTDTERANWLKTMSKKRSRMVLTSGGLAPVLDAGGGEHSVFARSLLEILRANEDLIEGAQLYREVAARVTYAAANLQFEQLPQYAPIRYAGHETGDFFLVPNQ